MKNLLLVSILLVLCVEFGSTSEYDHLYENNEEVSLWMNTVNPNRNPQETYSYYSLPYCQGPKKSIHHYRKTLAEALLGVELQFSGLEIEFKSKIPKTTYCSIKLTKESFQSFEYAIKNRFNYQMFLDDLSILGQVGEFDEFGNSSSLYTHMQFDIGYNGNRIVDVNLTFTNEKIKLESIKKIVEFSYEVNWVESNVKFEDRFEKYLDRRFFEYRIHWQSILGSGILALVLVGIVGIILVRIFKDKNKDSVWKQNIQEDVFRNVENSLVFSIFVANGCHIGIVTLFVIIFQIVFSFYENRGSTLSAIIYTYILIAPVNGFFGSQLYYKTDGYQWIKQSILSGLAFPGIISGITLGINFIFMYYHSSRVIHFKTMVTVASIITFIILPLNVLGSYLARKVFGESTKIQENIPENPPRPIPKKSIFLNPLVLFILGGILPFGSILVEIYFILVTFWGNDMIYYLYSYTLISFLILIIVTTCVAIICTYFLLKAEDYRWQWISFGLGASTGVYVYLYSIFYFFFRTNMEGLLQIAFYFVNMALFSVALGVLCGTFGYVGTKIFVSKIYAKLFESNRNDEKAMSGKEVFLVIQVL